MIQEYLAPIGVIVLIGVYMWLVARWVAEFIIWLEKRKK